MVFNISVAVFMSACIDCCNSAATRISASVAGTLGSRRTSSRCVNDRSPTVRRTVYRPGGIRTENDPPSGDCRVPSGSISNSALYVGFVRRRAVFVDSFRRSQ
jgi:hypothetical protein